MSELEKGMEMSLLLNAADESSAGKAVAAALYHLRSGGRRIRARLAIHASLSLGLSSADALALASTVELLHNASLVHDDLQDDSLLRHENHRILVTKDSLIQLGNMYHDQNYLVSHETFGCTTKQDDEHGNDLHHICNHIPDDNQTEV